MTVAFPSSIVPAFSPPKFTLINASRSGGQSLTGTEQTVSSGSDSWRCTGQFHVRGKLAVLDFYGFITEMAGRSGETVVPAFAGWQANWPMDGASRLLWPGLTREPEIDGTAYAYAEIPALSTISATVNTTAALSATSIAINKSAGSDIVRGQLFSIGNSLYRIVNISGVAGAVWTVTFRPKLRVAAPATTVVVLSKPVCLMKFATDDEGSDLPAKGGVVTLNFVEAF